MNLIQFPCVDLVAGIIQFGILMKLNDFSVGNASQRHHLTFQISTKQGVVTTNSLVEPSATGIKVFDQRKYTLIA